MGAKRDDEGMMMISHRKLVFSDVCSGGSRTRDAREGAMDSAAGGLDEGLHPLLVALKRCKWLTQLGMHFDERRGQPCLPYHSRG